MPNAEGDNMYYDIGFFSEMDLSAEFIVPTIYRLFGTAKTSPD